jgi:choline kinase
VIGLVLAAGKGERLRPLTDALPKTLLPVDGDRTILDVVLANFAAVGLERAVIVTGFAAGRVDELAPELERRHGLRVETVFNPKGEGALLSNGDTVHPPSVEQDVLAARAGGVMLAVDRHKPLGAEEMKVHLSPEGRLERINKALDPAGAHGEYIGITLIEPAAAGPLTDALEATWRRDPGLYYEDGFQELADRGGDVGAAAIRPVEWVEVDDHADLARARAICRS